MIMEIKISEIVTAKLEQMERDGIIQKKIEDTLEKSIMDAITSELDGYSFRHSISKQIADNINEVAANCGISAYNGFIAERVKAIIKDMYTEDISQKVQSALNDVMLKHHKDVKLSDIFNAYRKWVLENTDDSEKYERQKFTHQLDVEESGLFTHYTCTFADHQLDNTFSYHERGDVVIKFCQYKDKNRVSISNIYFNNRDISKSLRIGTMTEFEAFVVNLFYNKTEVMMDVDNVEIDPYFDVDC